MSERERNDLGGAAISSQLPPSGTATREATTNHVTVELAIAAKIGEAQISRPE